MSAWQRISADLDFDLTSTFSLREHSRNELAVRLKKLGSMLAFMALFHAKSTMAKSLA